MEFLVLDPYPSMTTQSIEGNFTVRSFSKICRLFKDLNGGGKTIKMRRRRRRENKNEEEEEEEGKQ